MHRRSGLWDRLLSLLPGAKRSDASQQDPDDALDDPALLALIASEAADLAPPESVDDIEMAKTDGSLSNNSDANGSTLDDQPQAAPEASDTDGSDTPFDAVPLGPIGPDQSDVAYRQQQRRRTLLAVVAVSSILGIVSGGGWLLFGGNGDDVKRASGPHSHGASVYNENQPTLPQSPPEIERSDRVDMAFPTPSMPPGEHVAAEEGTAVAAGLGDERSLARRPWLTDTDDDTRHHSQSAQGEPHHAAVAEAEHQPPAHSVAKTQAPLVQPARNTLITLGSELPPLIEPAHPPVPSKTGSEPPSYAALPVPAKTPQALGPAPLGGLVRHSPLGPLPVKLPDGASPWTVYARPFKTQAGRARVSVVITGLGLDPDAANAAIGKLPPEVSLSFSPYAHQAEQWVVLARKGGHEALLDLPMEPRYFPVQDPGPLGLLTMLPRDEIETRLRTVLGKAVGYVGVVGGQPGNFADSRDHMRFVVDALGKRGIMLVQAPDALSGLIGDTTRGAPVAPAVVRLDGKRFATAVEARLDYLIAVSRNTGGVAVGIAEATPLLFQTLVDWAQTLPQKKATLAPVSEAGRAFSMVADHHSAQQSARAAGH